MRARARTLWIGLAFSFAASALLPMAGSAATVGFHVTGDINPLSQSDVIVLESQLTLKPGENPTDFAWSLQCTGCQFIHYPHYARAEAYFPTAVDWTGGPFPSDFSDPLYGDDFVGSPEQIPGVAGRVGPIGTSATSRLIPGATFTGQGNAMTVGYVTVHISARHGRLETVFSETDGFFCGDDACAFDVGFESAVWGYVIPEPSAAFLYGIGLIGLVARRRRAA
jgi:hypothetical protein